MSIMLGLFAIANSSTFTDSWDYQMLWSQKACPCAEDVAVQDWIPWGYDTWLRLTCKKATVGEQWSKPDGWLPDISLACTKGEATTEDLMADCRSA